MATRLAEIVKRSGRLAKEMEATSDKMASLTDQMAREVERSKHQANVAREQMKNKPE